MLALKRRVVREFCAKTKEICDHGILYDTLNAICLLLKNNGAIMQRIFFWKSERCKEVYIALIYIYISFFMYATVLYICKSSVQRYIVLH